MMSDSTLPLVPTGPTITFKDWTTFQDIKQPQSAVNDHIKEFVSVQKTVGPGLRGVAMTLLSINQVYY